MSRFCRSWDAFYGLQFRFVFNFQLGGGHFVLLENHHEFLLQQVFSTCFPPLVSPQDRWLKNPKHVTHRGGLRANFGRAWSRSVRYCGAPCPKLSSGTFSFTPSPPPPPDMLDSLFVLCDWQCGPINLTGIVTTCSFSFAARLTRPEGPKRLENGEQREHNTEMWGANLGCLLFMRKLC